MKVRDTIFDSKSERDTYTSLKSRWSSKLAIIPQVPICKIIDMNSNEIDSFRREHFPSVPSTYFFQAHTDYTVCNLEGRPLLSIEFDGMYGGYSSGSTYLTEYHLNQERETKLNYKLKLAELAGYPLLVVSNQEDEAISPWVTLTILDGIIGQCVSSLLAPTEIQRCVNEQLNPNSTHSDETIQDMIWDTEIMLELEWDPIARLAAECLNLCH